MKRLFQLWRDESGGIMIIAAFGLLILIGILALSIDHGRNYLTQSDLEAKLTSLTKAAGNEYTYWEIRKQVTTAAQQMGLPPVSNENCQIYVLCDNSISQTEAMDKLEQFVQSELARTNPGVTVSLDRTNGGIQTNSSGKRFLLFNSTSSQQKDFDKGSFLSDSQRSPTVTVESGVLINTLEARGVASQIVFSLDQDSKNQLNPGATDMLKQVFDLVKSTVAATAVPTSDLRLGLTLGNIPVRGPMSGSSVVAGGLDGSLNNNMGHSGGLLDNQPQFSGTDIGTLRIASQSRKYTYKGSFTASDALVCANPVWTYRTVVSRTTCNQPYEEISGAQPADCPPPWGGSDDKPPGIPDEIGGYPDEFPPQDPPPPPPAPCDLCDNADAWINSFDQWTQTDLSGN